MGHGHGSWRIHSILYEIRELVLYLAISLVHVPRYQNALADCLENRGVLSQSLFCENFIPKDY